MILFLTETCSHCQRADQYLTDNNLYQTREIQKVYIDQSPQNLALYTDTATAVGYQNGGVPLLITDEQTFVEGADPIINYLSGNTETLQETTLTQQDQSLIQDIIEEQPQSTTAINPLYIAAPILIVSLYLLLRRK